MGKDLLPVPLRLLPAEPTQAALARASRSAQPREARQQASLTLSNKHDGSAGGFGRYTGDNARGHEAEGTRCPTFAAVTN